MARAVGVDVQKALDAATVRRWSAAAVDALDAHRGEIDQINVFPVADADTGTNLAFTLRAGAEQLRAEPGVTAAATLAALAQGAVLGARGNSGVIVAQLLRGLAEHAASAGEPLDAEGLRAGLAAGVELAYFAVADPVEGTVLTVAREAVAAVTTPAVDLGELLGRAVAAADEALQRTRQQLPSLQRAGVVDAGGLGFVVLLDALAAVVTGRPARTARGVGPAITVVVAPDSAMPEHAFGYEVQYLLDAPPDRADALRERLSRLGDSVVVGGTGADVWNVHVHVNDVGAAIEAGIAAGATHDIRVVRFDEPVPATGVSGGVAVVTVAPGPALAHLFAREGASVVDVSDGRSPDAEQVLAALLAAAVPAVVLLPNAAGVDPIAEQAAAWARARGVRVAVLPTRSPVQGLAAVAVHDPGREFEADVVAMAEAAAATRYAEVTVAQERSLTSVGECERGDVLGLIDGEVVEIGRGLVAVTFALVARLLGVGAELMTVLLGADAPANLGALIEQQVRDRAPLTEVVVYAGGQTRYPVVIGVE